MRSEDRIGWEAEWSIHQFRDPTGEIATLLRAGMSLENAMEAFPAAFLGADRFEGNVALDEGLQELIDIICGLSSPTRWGNANARIGVGNSSAAEDASQTGLQGTSKAFKAMDGGYPQRSAQTAEWRANFDGEAEFSVEETL